MANASPTAGARFLTAAVVALLLGACGGTSTNSTTAPRYGASSPSAASPSSAAPVGTSVGVIEKEFSITLATASFTPGPYTFTVQNQGSFPHNLTIKGPGVDTKASPTMGRGESGSLTVALQKGSYELWCSVPGHKDRGMDVTIKVG